MKCSLCGEEVLEEITPDFEGNMWCSRCKAESKGIAIGLLVGIIVTLIMFWRCWIDI
jgi:hypothetical protein